MERNNYWPKRTMWQYRSLFRYRDREKALPSNPTNLPHLIRLA